MSLKHRSVSLCSFYHATILLTNNLAREDIAAKARSRDSPSTGAITASRRDTQHSRRPDVLHNFRPLELSTPPVTIYHPVFALFLRLIKEEPQKFTPEELDRAQCFITAATDIYQTEEKRIDALTDMVRAVHTQVLLKKTFQFTSQKLIPDGAVCTAEAPNGFETVSAIIEVTNEIGDGNCDPLAQAECAYIAIYSSTEVCGWRPSRFPMLKPQC